MEYNWDRFMQMSHSSVNITKNVQMIQKYEWTLEQKMIIEDNEWCSYKSYRSNKLKVVQFMFTLQ